MFGSQMEIPEELKDVVRHSSEAELTELIMRSLEQAGKDPDAFAASAPDFPPLLRDALKSLPIGTSSGQLILKPIAQSMAKMLISQIKHGKPIDPMSLVSDLVGTSTNSNQSSIEEISYLSQLASTQLMKDEFEAAEANFKRTIDLAEKTLPTDDPLFADAFFGLAVVRENQGKSADADLLYTKALSIAEKAYADQPAKLVQMIETLANFYEGQKLYSKSNPLFTRAISLQEKAFGDKNLDLAEQFVRYTLILEARGNFAEAEMWCYRALTIKHDLLAPNDPDLARNQALLASIYIGQEQYSKAEPIITTVLAILRENGGKEMEMDSNSNHDLLDYPLEIYARLLKATNREEEANAIERSIEQSMETSCSD